MLPLQRREGNWYWVATTASYLEDLDVGQGDGRFQGALLRRTTTLARANRWGGVSQGKHGKGRYFPEVVTQQWHKAWHDISGIVCLRARHERSRRPPFARPPPGKRDAGGKHGNLEVEPGRDAPVNAFCCSTWMWDQGMGALLRLTTTLARANRRGGAS